MALSEKFFEKMKEYQDIRAGIIERFEKRMKTLESANGSKYYEEEVKKATDQRNNDLKELKSSKGVYLFNILDLMESKSNERKAEAPTEEQMRLLQTATTMRVIDEEYLDSVAYALKKNPSCLIALEDFAAANGLNKDYRSLMDDKKMSVERTRTTIQNLRKSIDDFVETDQNTNIERIIKSRAERYGETGDSIPKKREFTDKNSMYEIIAPWMDSESVEAFCAAVDS